MKTAIIAGVSGQDGSHMADLLLSKDYKVYGLVRRNSAPNYWRIDHILDKIDLIHCDVSDPTNVTQVISQIKPDECYNFASMSQVGISFKEPVHAINSVGLNCLYFLEAIRHNSPQTKYIYASSSEQFGSQIGQDGFQSIDTPMKPNSPYACAKLLAFNLISVYRRSYGVKACASVCFNHESPRRGIDFVTKKITDYVGRLRASSVGGFVNSSFPKLKLGNIESFRDWTHAKDCVLAFWLMLQQDVLKDYVISSMETHSVKEFLELAFSRVSSCLKEDLDYRDWIETDQQLYRPCEVEFLKGNSAPIRDELGWKPQYSFRDLVNEMVDYDIAKYAKI